MEPYTFVRGYWGNFTQNECPAVAQELQLEGNTHDNGTIATTAAHLQVQGAALELEVSAYLWLLYWKTDHATFVAKSLHSGFWECL